jgi:Cyclin
MSGQAKRLRHPAKPQSPTAPYVAQPRELQDWSLYTEQLTPANVCTTAGPAAESPRVQPRRLGFLPGQFESDAAYVRIEAGGNITDGELVEAITSILENICSINNGRISTPAEVGVVRAPYRSAAYPDGSSSIFFSLQKPAVEMRYYVSRLVKYMHVSSSVFIVALIYLDRVHASDEILALQDLNVHRLITTALAVACKFLEDEVHRNSTICRIGGVPSTAEMNLLETQFLRRINWNCSVSADSYELYRSNVFKSGRPGPLLAICPSACSETQTEDESSESPRDVAGLATRRSK